MKIHATLSFILSLTLLTACQNADTLLSGDWKSDQVRLLRLDLEEVFVFHIKINGNADAPESGLMDVTYFAISTPIDARVLRVDLGLIPGTDVSLEIEERQNPDPTTTRLIRQKLTVSKDIANGDIILRGQNPELISGPDIIGKYESDTLTCQPTAYRTLTCQWGSDGHGNPLTVTLKRE